MLFAIWFVVSLGIIGLSLFSYFGNLSGDISSLFKAILLGSGGWLIFSLLIYIFVNIKIDNDILVYKTVWTKKIKIKEITHICRTSRPKPFDKMYESLTVFVQKNDQIKEYEINLNYFDKKDIEDLLKRLKKLNHNIHFEI